ERLDEVPISRIGRHPPRGSVGMRQETSVLERRELVSDGRRRDVEPVSADELNRRHRLGRRDVFAYDRAEHLTGARIKVRKLSGIGFVRQLALSYREC